MQTGHVFAFGGAPNSAEHAQKSFERVSTHPLVRMTQRRRLDAFLVERAADAGAEFRDGVRVEELSKDGIVRGEGLRATAAVVIGALGAETAVKAGFGRSIELRL